jgi:hypothetical protein
LQLVFTSSEALISRLIRKITKSEVSHVALRLSLEEVIVFLHADVGGVQVSPEDQFYRGRTLRYAFAFKEPVSPKQAVEYIGDRYDYSGLVWNLFRIAGKWLGYSWKRPLQSPHSVVCSEFIARLALPSFVGLDPESTSPQDLLEICKKAPELIPVPLPIE